MLRVLEIKKTCDASPAQWEGIEAAGRPVYARYRWGYLEVSVGEKDEDTDNAVNGQEIFGKQLGDNLDGALSYAELKTATAGIIEFPPEEKS